MRRKLSPFIASLVLVFFAGETSSAGLNSGFLDKSGEGASARQDTSNGSEKAPSPTRRNLPSEEDKDVVGDAKIQSEIFSNLSYETIQSLTQLLRTTPPGPVRNRILLNRAAAMSLFARKRHLASKQAKLDEFNRKYIEAAIRDATEIMTAPGATQSEIQRGHNLLGFSYLYTDDIANARKHFNEVLRMNPNAGNAGWIGLFLAEDLFDSGNYAEAIQLYSRYYSKMSAQGKELSIYKMAWCHINLNRNDKAEELFLQLIKTNSRQGLAKDSIRDLAYLVTHRKDPLRTIQRTEALLPQPQDKIDFLNAARVNLEALNQVSMHNYVIARLLQLETNPEKKLELLLANMRVNRLLFASHRHMGAFRKVDAFARAGKMTASSPEIRKYSSVLEAEMLAILKAFVDTFAGRTRTPEKFERKDLSNALKEQFIFFSWYLLESKVRPMVVNLWLDVCVESRDWACVDMASELVFADKARLGQYLERAHVDQLAALDELVRASPEPKKGEYEKRRQQRIAQFIETYPNSDQWLRVARLHAQHEIEQGRTKETIPLLDRIYTKDPTPDSYFRLQFARFQAKEYEGLLDDPRNAKFAKPEARLRELWRETCLIQAQEAKKSENIAEYRKYIRRFLDLRPDAEKARAAREDFFRFLLQKELHDDAIAEFMALPARERANPAFKEIRDRLWYLSMQRGRFPEAQELLSRVAEDDEKAAQNLLFRRMLATMAMGGAPSSRALAEFRGSNRDYLLGLLALVKPQTVLAYFRKAPPERQSDRDLALLALQIRSGVWQLRKSSEAIRLLGAKHVFYDPRAEAAVLPVEKRIDRIRFPGQNLKPATLARIVQNVVAETQSIRSAVPKQIQGRPAAIQLRAVEKARDLEKKVGELILNSPMPKELTPEQLAEYKKGLEEAAKEFLDQSQEFEQIAVKIRETMDKTKAAISARLLPPPKSMGDWQWPGIYTSDGLKAISGLVTAGNTLGALAMLDFLRSEQVKDPADFFRIRAGILLSTHTSEALRVYLLNELENNQQNAIIEDWRKLGS